MFMPQRKAPREPDRVAVINLTRGTTLADAAEYARGPWRRCIGLLGRAALPIGEGLIFTPCTGLHTIGMRFPINLMYLQREGPGSQGGIVTRLRTNLRPFRVALAIADLVIELPAGTCVATATAMGDEIVLRRAVPDSAMHGARGPW
jgi:uncharacterized protein